MNTHILLLSLPPHTHTHTLLYKNITVYVPFLELKKKNIQSCIPLVKTPQENLLVSKASLAHLNNVFYFIALKCHSPIFSPLWNTGWNNKLLSKCG